MEIGLKRGVTLFPKRIESAIRRSDGRTGQIHVPRATYSLRMSFWMVPVSLSRATPCLSAQATYIARMIAAVPLIVKDVEILDKSMPLNRISISDRFDSDTPTLPISGRAIVSVGSSPHWVGRSSATERPV